MEFFDNNNGKTKLESKMAKQYKTPGVYVLEENAFGSSIVANETAVPVFIGFTEKMTYPTGEELGKVEGSKHIYVPVLIQSLLEYEQSFGGADTTGSVYVTEQGTSPQSYYTADIKREGKAYTPGFMYPAVANYFANGGGSCYIVSLGAYLDFQEELATSQVEMEFIGKAIEMAEPATLILPTDLIRYGAAHYYNWCSQLITYSSSTKKQFCILDVVMADPTSPVLNMDDVTNYRKGVSAAVPGYAGAYYPYLKSLTAYAYDEANVYFDNKPLSQAGNAKIGEIKSFLSAIYINMPASPFMAGIYSRLDNATGVWTPPANVSPSGISGPLVNLTSKQQEGFNVDPTAGKSINAIRSFTGKGTLVWGARTNDGNSMDWRYVNVRRLFISMETDISKALEAYVFKPNVHNTWVEVKTMIESYLFGLYNAGAFAGTTPESSYQVLIGVGETMTDEDVLNGYMRVSIMVAPVRPAEFIVLTFSQLVGQ